MLKRIGLAEVTALGVLCALCFAILTQGGWVPLVPAALALVVTGGCLAAYAAFKTQRQRFSP